MSEQANAEARVFARYLGVDNPSDYVLQRYASTSLEPAFALPDTPFDRFLLRVARPSLIGTRTADIHARFFRPNAVLRRRLILLLAILESTPATEQGLDRIEQGSLAGFVFGLVPRALVSVFLLVGGLALFLPARILLPAEDPR